MDMCCDNTLDIRLLGPFDARVGSNPLPHLRTRKGQHLLSMLALRMGREVQREWLVDNLWPDSDPDKGFYNLRRTLTDLRAAMGPARRFMSAPTPHSLRLDGEGGVSVDAAHFENLILKGDGKSLEEAVGLYRGPLLEGWPEEWLLSEREALQQACLKALNGLAEGAAGRQDWPDAARWLKRLVALDPYQEEAQQKLMEALAHNGDHAAATLSYREFRLLLRRDLNIEPSAETGALFQRLQQDALSNRKRAEKVFAEPEVVRPRLPAALTSFIGRVDERRRVRSLLGTTRLLTLAGAGGCGKTRLALEVAREAESEFEGRIVWVELASLNRSELVWRVLASVLETREESATELAETVCRMLASHPRLLILDNCEHLLDRVGEMISTILQRCPLVRVLATSREPITVTGEVTFRVPSLSVPEWTVVHSTTIPALMEYEAVRLFAERAAQAESRFILTEHNASAVAQVCRRLDGMPLAIELAASRVGTLTTEQIAARLDDRFGLLKWKRRDVPPRQQTLRALIDWSYDLLTVMERVLFRRLAVFQGGFTLESAEAVCAAEGSELLSYSGPRDPCLRSLRSERTEPLNTRTSEDLTTDEVLELLSRLVDKSLIIFDQSEGAGRYRLLETIREYAQEQLRESGEEAPLRARHLDYFLGLAEESPGPGDLPRWLNRLETEHGNLRVALDTGVEFAEGGQSAMRLCAAMRPFWFHRGYFGEGRDRCAAALSLMGASVHTRERAQALRTACIMAQQQADSAAAREFQKESLEIWRELDDRRGIAYSIHELAIVECEQGNFTEAWRLNEESLDIFRDLGDRAGIADLLSGLGVVAFDRGDYATARQLHEESLRIRRELGQSWGICFALCHLTTVAVELGEYDMARTLGTESFAVLSNYGEPAGIAWCLDGFGIMASRTGKPERGAQLMASASRIRNEIGVTVPPGERARYEQGLSAAREPLGEDAFAVAWADGLALTTDQAISLALADTPGQTEKARAALG
jgi:predicted ATPase/DNA-binding SARP family transcriptional activator